MAAWASRLWKVWSILSNHDSGYLLQAETLWAGYAFTKRRTDFRSRFLLTKAILLAGQRMH